MPENALLRRAHTVMLPGGAQQGVVTARGDKNWPREIPNNCFDYEFNRNGGLHSIGMSGRCFFVVSCPDSDVHLPAI